MQENITRRDWLRRSLLAGAGIGLAAVAGAGCDDIRNQFRAATGPDPASYLPLPHDADALQEAVHVVNRVAFGPRPGDVARIANQGALNWVKEQLQDSESMGESPAVAWRVNGLDTQQMARGGREVMWSIEYEQLLLETQQAALLRAVYSRHQLHEVMADFWTNHFNLYALKSEGQVYVPTDTETVLRPHVLGSFPAMLRASAHSPAMLNYLDNKLNKKGVANENYARELLELHTLGVNSGYTQKDIQEVARCFTGWTLDTGWHKGEFLFDAKQHDEDGKFIPFLNLTIAPKSGKNYDGQQDADEVLETLGTHVVTGRFLARKLCRRFLGMAPDAMVEKAAQAFTQSRGDIPSLLRPILTEALFDPALNQPILKRPLDMIVSSLRVIAADTDCGGAVQKHLAAMGQPLYQWPMPDGFPEKATAWTGSLLPRWNFALALTANTMDGTQVDLQAPLKAANAGTDAARLDVLIETILQRPADSAEIAPLRRQLQTHILQARQKGIGDLTTLAETTGLLLASPQFQWK